MWMELDAIMLCASVLTKGIKNRGGRMLAMLHEQRQELNMCKV